MNQAKRLEDYCKKMLLDVDVDIDTLTVGDKLYLIIDDDNDLFDEELDFIPENSIDLEEGYSGFVYEFGGRWYLHEYLSEVSLEEFRYLNKAKQKLPTKSFLGIHSGYELMNGIGLYKDWVKKAEFLGVEALAICEKRTLSGALVFQNECTSANIKSIIGMAIPVINNQAKAFEVKLYVKNFQGWLNLLKFNSLLNVDKSHTIELDFLRENSDGLFIVADPKSMNFEDAFDMIDYYQLETVNFMNEEKDRWFINNLEKFIGSDIQPISIADAYYLEKDDYIAREVLWDIAKAYDDKTNNQYFKNKDQYAAELIGMFAKGSGGWLSLYKNATENEAFLVENCNFKYDTDTRHLPKYIMSKDEAEEFDSNEDLFLHLIKKGFKAKKIKDPQQYIERLKIEIEVLKMGDVIDYFLSLHDIIQFSKREKMLTGIGRGSAGGSLIAYLLGIIQINPLEFDLLFERFLNSGRMGEYQDRPLYSIELEDDSIVELAEGALVRIIRDEKETVVFIHDLKEGDDIIRY